MNGVLTSDDTCPSAALFKPAQKGVGEVWVDTEYENTAGKSKPGTVTAVDASSWKITRKVALPADAPADDDVTAYAGMGGQGVLPIPLVYNGWVQKLPQAWKNLLTQKQLHPIP